jgi:8-oxo-dGTP pyrophosphatase MutT (NUDIX family)
MDAWSTLAARLAALAAATEEAPVAERPSAAVAMLLRRADAPEVLLLRRKEREGDRWSGQIALPGGYRSAGDASLAATAVRETSEEVGIDLERSARPLGRLPSVPAKARGLVVGFEITPFVWACVEECEPIPGDEAQEAFWFPLARAVRGELATTYQYRHGTLARALPAWEFEGRVVWGLTHEMLSALLRLGRLAGE